MNKLNPESMNTKDHWDTDDWRNFHVPSQNSDQPTFHKTQISFGNLTAKLKGEQFKGLPILDTEVNINGENLCCITWADKEAFFNEINTVISKYRI